MLTIADLKLPPNFSGVGMHYDPYPVASPDDPNVRTAQHRDFQEMAALGITCVTVLNPTWYIYQLANEFGMLVLSRSFHRAHQPWNGDAAREAARSQNCVWLEQVDNETVLADEWDGNQVNLDFSGRLLVQASMQVYDSGGVVVWQAFGLNYFRYCVGLVHEYQAERIFKRFMISIHNYGINHPPNYTQDENGFLQFKFWAKWCQETIGFVPLMIGGEWGWGLNESADNRFPPVSDELRTQYEMASYDSFRTGILPDGTPLPDYFLACNKWLWHARGRTYWEDDAIVKADGSWRESFRQAMLARPRFVRRFSGDSVPAPDPEPSPTPDPVPVPTARCRVYNRAGSQLGAFNSAENALKMAVAEDGYIQPYGAAKLDIVAGAAAEVEALRREVIALQNALALEQARLVKVQEAAVWVPVE